MSFLPSADVPESSGEGTIADIIADKGWKYPLLITKIDDRVVRPAEFPRAVVPAGAIVLIHHLMSGG